MRFRDFMNYLMKCSFSSLKGGWWSSQGPGCWLLRGVENIHVLKMDV
jgi:hypothetical protein